MSNEQRDGRNDSDFLHGRWVNRNRRLRVRLQGCTEWDEFNTIDGATVHLTITKQEALDAGWTLNRTKPAPNPETA